MSDKTNEEKLRTLQERLATIQQKKEIQQEEKTQQNKPVAPVFEEELVNHPNIDPIAKTPRQPRNNSSLFKYFILFFIIILVGYSGFYAYKSIDFNSFFTSSNPIEIEQEKEEEIIYDKSEFGDGNFIIVLSTFDKQESANKERDKLTEKGYNCGVYLLAAVSNSEQEVFQTYIGPFNTEGEANQYLNSDELTSSGGVIEL